MKTKIYLIALIVIIMAAGARTMFEVAYHGMTREHDFAPDKDTVFLFGLLGWFLLMMVADVLLLNYKNAPKRNLLIAVLSVGILVPVIYMFVTR